jgi:opacity protein-like surface antigen
MRWWAIPLAAIGLAQAAGAAELDADYLRGSMAPRYAVPSLDEPVLDGPSYPLAAPEPAPGAPPPVYSWTGFYIGGTASFGWGHFDTPTATTFTGAYFPNATVVGAVNAAGVQGTKPFNVSPGVTAGYNWQAGNVVLGVEADIQSIRLSGGALTGPIVYPGFSPVTFAIASAASADWLVTARPRIGWAQDDWLVYGTAGAAITTLNAQFTFADLFGSFESGIFSTTRVGFAAGGGIEASLWDHWSAKAEYLYVHFSPVSVASNLMVFPATPVPSQPFTHSADLSAHMVRLGLNYRFGDQSLVQAAAGMSVKALGAAPVWNWTGLYIGAHLGAAASSSNFADPFGTSGFGDTARSPGFLVGGQLGYNWQVPGTRWVLGIEADADRMDSDGTVTCFAASGSAINATCRMRPQAAATLTGRVGYALDPMGRTLIYGKAGAAWANSKADMALGNDLAGFVGPNIASSSANLDFFGWTLGVGAEYAMTPAWSVKFEYDYLALGSRDLSNLGSATFDPNTGLLLSASPPGSSGVTQNVQSMKMGVNYKWANAGAFAEAAPPQLSGWQVEAGGRYFGSWGQFHKDIGQLTSSGVPSISSVSRLTYDDMQMMAGEFFGRVDLPWWNLFVKGYAGGGFIKNGHMNDEDFGIPLGILYAAYSNTLSPVVTGRPVYGAVDVGFDFLRAAGYKLGAFAGFFYFSQPMSAFGCSPLANVNCIPPILTGDNPAITELDRWRALRVGIAGEGMLADRLKLSGEVAYLPYATFEGVDQHFFGNSGELASNNPETGNAKGVQLEVLLSYYLTPNLSLGVGGRYWGLWTTNAQAIRNVDNGLPIPATAPQFFKGVTEQAGAFLQVAYCFGPEWF